MYNMKLVHKIIIYLMTKINIENLHKKIKEKKKEN